MTSMAFHKVDNQFLCCRFGQTYPGDMSGASMLLDSYPRLLLIHDDSKFASLTRTAINLLNFGRAGQTRQ